jgi:hypothetical protein
MIVTLDVYSGRPNPSWRLSDKDHARLLERVSGRALADETEVATAPLLVARTNVRLKAEHHSAKLRGLTLALRSS